MLSQSTIILAIIAVIWIILSIIWSSRNKKSSLKIYPLLILLRSVTLERAIKYLGSKYDKFWRKLGAISDAIFPFLLVLSSLYLIVNLVFLIIGIGTLTIGPIPIGTKFIVVVPFVTIPYSQILIYIIIGFLIAVFPHEIFHGVVARSNEFDIKSAGVIVSLGVFGGYVELDIEEKINKILDEIAAAAPEKRNDGDPENKNMNLVAIKKFRKVLAAGILANIIILGLFWGLYTGFTVTGALEKYGVKIVDLDPKGNAIKYGLQAGDIIISINGHRIRSIEDFIGALSEVRPRDNISVGILRSGVEKHFDVVVGEKNGRAYLGVVVQQYIKSRIPIISDENAYSLYYFIYLNIILEFLIVVINALPCFFLDGSNWLNIFLVEKLGGKGIKLGFIINIIFTLILVLNFIMPAILKMI